MKEEKESIAGEEEAVARQDLFMGTDEQHVVLDQKPGFEESSIQTEKDKLQKEGETAATLPKSAEDIPRTPLSERFPREEKQVVTKIKFKNTCSFTVSIAIIHHAPECAIEGKKGSGPLWPWRVEGWWNLEPGETKSFSTSYPYFYYYGEGGDYTWSGPVLAYVRLIAFSHCYSTPSGVSPSPNFMVVGMREIYCNDYSTYPINLQI